MYSQPFPWGSALSSGVPGSDVSPPVVDSVGHNQVVDTPVYATSPRWESVKLELCWSSQWAQWPPSCGSGRSLEPAGHLELAAYLNLMLIISVERGETLSAATIRSAWWGPGWSHAHRKETWQPVSSWPTGTWRTIRNSILCSDETKKEVFGSVGRGAASLQTAVPRQVPPVLEWATGYVGSLWRKWEAVIAAIDALIRHWGKAGNTYVHMISPFNTFAQISKLLSCYGMFRIFWNKVVT